MTTSNGSGVRPAKRKVMPKERELSIGYSDAQLTVILAATAFLCTAAIVMLAFFLTSLR